MLRRQASVLLVSSVLLCLGGCRGSAPEPEVWFVQATDPHLFHESSTKLDEAVRLHQETLNQQGFEDLLHTLGALPGTRAEPRFLVITGNFGLDRFAAEDTSAEAEAAVQYLVGTLSKSPVDTIYLLPGNNDVGGEEPAGPPVRRIQGLWSQVQKGLAGTGVTLHDLTACYFEGGLPSGCAADVEGTPYRLLGFPSHSFKDGVSEERARVQMEQLDTLASLVEQAERQGRRALILTHVPEMDDPNALALQVFQNVQRYPQGEQPTEEGQKEPAPGLPDWARTSAWNMHGAAFEKWKEVVGSSTVAGVLAGHFHDSHKEIYRRPYDWPTRAAARADLGKLYLAPPLSVRFQDQSPVQARGFALFGLPAEGPPERTLYWFDWRTRTFEPEPAPLRLPSLTWPAAARWFWTVAGDATDLARAAVIAIAFLAAFLTIIQLWEVPPPKDPMAKPGAQEEGSASSSASGGGSPSALQGNFGKTVLAGLGGMLALSFLESLWSMEGLNTTAYYVLLFVTFFFGLLLLYAIVQSLIEALRSRLVTQYPVRPWRGREPLEEKPPADRNQLPGGQPPTADGQTLLGTEDEPPSKASGAPVTEAETRQKVETSSARSAPRFGSWFHYWRTRTWHWVLSLRMVLLILFDTFFNVLRGRNQLQTAVFEAPIIALNWSIVKAADGIRREVEAVLRQALKNRQKPKTSSTAAQSSEQDLRDSQNPPEEDIRVSVSVLSRDEENLFYVAREKGSLARGFDRRSVAWVSVYTGKPFWWKQSYFKLSDVALLTNPRGGLPLLPEGPIALTEYYQKRAGSDYEAFIVLPMPWDQRGATDAVRRAGLQISFRKEDMMDSLFDELEDKKSGQPRYLQSHDILRDAKLGQPSVKNLQLRTVIFHSLGILEELFSAFDETIFELHILPKIRPN